MANETIRQVTHIDNVKLSDDGRALVLIDQTRLPNELVYLTLTEAQEIWDAIHYLRVRGAPAIGIAAGYGLYVLARQIGDTITSSVLAPEDFVSADEHSAYAAGGSSDLRGDVAVFIAKLNKQAEFLNSSRPTAVNLSWALKRMLSCALKASGTGAGIPEILEAMHSECVAIHEEDIRMCRAISEYGLSLLKEGDGVLTHCNAGPLATSRYGTGQGPLFLAKEQGVNIRVFADETRPLLQGARLTSYELARAGVDVTLICDNMASIVMKNGWVQACMVGCDRVAANGDAANKIGTSGVAILAKHYGIPFYVLGPSSTIDMNCPTGDDIKIEERKPDEIKEMFYEKPVALPEVKCYNPAFDVTDHSLITAIITEKGIIRPPFKEQFATLFS